MTIVFEAPCLTAVPFDQQLTTKKTADLKAGGSISVAEGAFMRI